MFHLILYKTRGCTFKNTINTLLDAISSMNVVFDRIAPVSTIITLSNENDFDDEICQLTVLLERAPLMQVPNEPVLQDKRFNSIFPHVPQCSTVTISNF